MKNTLWTFSLLTVALTLGCKPSEANPKGETADKTAVQPSPKIEAVATDATAQRREYNFGQKTEFLMAMRTQLAELNRSLDELSAKTEKSSEAVKAEAAPKIAVLREKATALNKQVEELADATLSTWNVMKADTEKAFADLKQRVAQSGQAVADKIAP